MPELTESQRKALIEAVTAYWHDWCDAWDRGLTDNERELVAACFLAGVRWAQEQKR